VVLAGLELLTKVTPGEIEGAPTARVAVAVLAASVETLAVLAVLGDPASTLLLTALLLLVVAVAGVAALLPAVLVVLAAVDMVGFRVKLLARLILAAVAVAVAVAHPTKKRAPPAAQVS
jgi:hypothetical protein